MPDALLNVDPRFVPDYAGFYLQGIVEHTGYRSLRSLPFTREGFPSRYVDEQPLAFALAREGRECNVYIDAKDGAELDPFAAEWADVYAKINVHRRDQYVAYERHVVPIGPSHALKVWGPADSLRVARESDLAGGRLTDAAKHYRRFLAACRYRVTGDHYEPGTSDDRYVFFNATLWPNKHREVNPPRADFVRVCRAIEPRIEFEGGFIPPRHGDMPEYADLVASRRFTLQEYLDRVRRSAVVFNNPAAHGCLGWKLGEFLRLGKAIISLPLSRELPRPLVHGEHVHIVDGSREALTEAVLELLEDRAYRERLERAARSYYLDHLAPARLLRRVADAAFGVDDVANSP